MEFLSSRGTAAFSSFDFLVIIDLMSQAWRCVDIAEAFKEPPGQNISRIDHPGPPNFERETELSLNRQIIALSSKSSS